MNRVTCLAGGVGAARFLQGLVKIVREDSLTVIVNTGDDIELYGLHISPDVDIITYTLAGIVDETKGWGIRGDTFHCLKMLEKFGYETWFKLGDKDFATHIYRTSSLKDGLSLFEVTGRFCQSLGVRTKILPMTNDKVETKIATRNGTIHFQEYLVERGAQDDVLDVRFDGIEKAHTLPEVINSIMTADSIIVCPSNPVVSIGPILSLKGIRGALKETSAKVIAISPIVGGAPIKGPADKLMRSSGLEVSAYSVANLYQDFLDVFIIDHIDQGEKERVETLGLRTVETNTIMKTMVDKVKLARVTLESVKFTT